MRGSKGGRRRVGEGDGERVKERGGRGRGKENEIERKNIMRDRERLEARIEREN